MEPDAALPLGPVGSSRTRGVALAGTALFVVILVAGETYAKWWPYAHKVSSVVATHTLHASSILADAGPAGAAPSWHGAWSFTVAYGLAIWPALLAAILIGAAAEVLLPRRALVRPFRGSSGWRASFAGGLVSLPCLMCTCCASPITVSLRRSDVPVAGALSYWLGNPLLNPVVLIILAIVLPWQYVVVRIVVGAIIVFAAAPLVARLAPRRSSPVPLSLAGRGPADPAAGLDASASVTAGRYAGAVARLTAFLIPEYFVVVLALGAFRGWLLPLDHGAATWGIGAVVVAAVAGTIFVIPTAAEVPIILGLVALGLPIAVTGTLVVALPALSLASMAMVGRSLSWRVTGAMAGVVMALALAAGALAAAL